MLLAQVFSSFSARGESRHKCSNNIVKTEQFINGARAKSRAFNICANGWRYVPLPFRQLAEEAECFLQGLQDDEEVSN
jgi:hypothetical protein